MTKALQDLYIKLIKMQVVFSFENQEGTHYKLIDELLTKTGQNDEA